VPVPPGQPAACPRPAGAQASLIGSGILAPLCLAGCFGRGARESPVRLA